MARTTDAKLPQICPATLLEDWPQYGLSFDDFDTKIDFASMALSEACFGFGHGPPHLREGNGRAVVASRASLVEVVSVERLDAVVLGDGSHASRDAGLQRVI